MFCQNCGKKNKEKAIYCISCGSKLIKSSSVKHNSPESENKNISGTKRNNTMQTGNVESYKKQLSISPMDKLKGKFEDTFGKETWKKLVGGAVTAIVLLFIFNFVTGFIGGFKEGFNDAYYDDIEVTSEIALYGESDASTRTVHTIKEGTDVGDFLKYDTDAVLFPDGEANEIGGISADPQSGLVWRFFINYEDPMPPTGDFILQDGQIITFNLDYVY